ncbi:hypothetical protein Hanom_Chr02g00165631 [Helianthus anomalus]
MSVSNAECNCTGINCSRKLLRARARHTDARAGLHPHAWCVHLAHRHDRVRHTHSGPCAPARVCHVTCEPLRARHTVAPFWLTVVRRARHIRPMHHARNRALMCTCSRAVAHDCHVMRNSARTHQGHAPASHVTNHLVLAALASPRARGQKYKGGSQAARGDASVRSAKCAIKAPHCASSPTPRTRARVRVRV